MNDCRAHSVPVPPDWAETGTAWRKQGTLSTNLLVPGSYAEVWTYSDPAIRGACVALPRDSGAPGRSQESSARAQPPGTPASGTTSCAVPRPTCWAGAASASSSPISSTVRPWPTPRTAPLATAATTSTCCRRTIRPGQRPCVGPWWRIDGNVHDARGDIFRQSRHHPRYILITTLPERPGWVNAFTTGGCAGACHEPPALSRAPAMPPACASSSTSPAGCYGTP